MTNGPSSTSDDDLFMLCLIGFGVLVVAAGSAATWWTQVVGWLLEHQIAVSAQQRPLLVLPNGGGAGLDMPRVAVAAAAVLLLMVAAAGAIRQYVRAHRLGSDELR